MRSYPALRLGGQVFFCAAVLSFFEPFCRDLRFFWLLAAGILAVSLAAVRLNRRLLRLALALIPGLAFLVPVSGWLSAAAGAAILLYTAVVLSRENFCPDFHTYRLEAGWTLAVCALLAVISFFWTQGGLSTLWFLICAVLLVLLALRMLQAGDFRSLTWKAASVGMLGTVLAAGVLAGLMGWVLRPLFIGFFRLFSTGLAYIVSLPLSLLAWFWTSLVGVSSTDQDPGLPDLVFSSGGNPNPSSQIHTEKSYDPVVIDIPWLPILTAAAVVLLVLAAIRFIRARNLRRPRKSRMKQAQDIERLLPTGKRKKSRGRSPDNRDQLRLVYSQYLDYLRGRGLDFDASDTTAEISEAASSLFLETDGILRGLYRKARYSQEEITDAELNAARESFDRLIAKENQRTGGQEASH